jgi:hypothetical protein
MSIDKARMDGDDTSNAHGRYAVSLPKAKSGTLSLNSRWFREVGVEARLRRE